MIRRLIFFLCFIYITLSNLSAQESYTINEYGTYVVASGEIKRVPIDQDLFFFKFWKEYAVFYCMGRVGMVIYNIESGFASEIIDEALPLKDSTGEKIIDDDNYFIIFTDGYVLTFDRITLEIIEQQYVGRLYEYPDIETADFESVKYERTGDRTIRYTGKNNYIDIIYGPKIDMSKEYGGHTVTCNNDLNRYVICVYDYDYGR